MSMGSKQIRSIDASNDFDNIETDPIDTSSDTTDFTAGTTAGAELQASSKAAEIATEVLQRDHRASSSVTMERDAHDDELQLDDPRAVALSEPFVERWSVLISTTNWEKGSIICAWRSELEAQSAPATTFSDEAWSRRVGGVTSQHVGRLRRVYQRFGTTHGSYNQLYWTHFLAALDWDDAEMWLEGASQSGWSVSQMRATRWQASGGDPAQQPIESEVVNVSIDEDYSPTPTALKTADGESEDARDKSRDIAEGPRYEGPDFGDEEDGNAVVTADSDGQPGDDWEDSVSAEPPVSPFASLPALPVDVADALEQFKLAIIRHRSSQWTDISQANMLAVIDAMRTFAVQ